MHACSLGLIGNTDFFLISRLMEKIIKKFKELDGVIKLCLYFQKITLVDGFKWTKDTRAPLGAEVWGPAAPPRCVSAGPSGSLATGDRAGKGVGRGVRRGAEREEAHSQWWCQARPGRDQQDDPGLTRSRQRAKGSDVLSSFVSSVGRGVCSFKCA